ncbi:MAG: NAD(P)/FAD-dependent oxidoreductase, partial [Gemmatimonadetes bacterium]|nr:NAD(P)/FAD-dependent oxidoreductase [Gemmatimonadota bacterium]
ELDAVVVGSGPNGLAAAITLAAHGLRVRVLEAADRPGGGLATDELTRPGFRHDVCSAIHPMGVGSPLFRALPLEAHGLTWIHPEAPLAHPLDDQPPAVLERSIDRTAAGLAPDVDAYRAFFEALVEDWDEAIPELLGPIGPRLALLRAARYGWRILGAADSVGTAAFQGTRARALFAGIAAHSIIPLDRAPSAAIALVLGAAGHAVGWPLPRGGSGALAAALVSILEALGGEVVCGRRVRSVFDLPPARATLLDLGPAGALEVLGAALPRRSRRALSRYPYGPGAFKLDWVLTEPIPWRDPACGRAGTVHLGGIAEEVAEAEAAVWRGVNHERPFVLLAQPTRFDETRAPVGGHVAWAYCHVVPGSED